MFDSRLHTRKEIWLNVSVEKHNLAHHEHNSTHCCLIIFTCMSIPLKENYFIFLPLLLSGHTFARDKTQI